MKRKPDIPFEDSLNDDWGHDLDMVEVPFGSRPLIVLGVIIICIALVIIGRVAYLNMAGGAYYAARAEDNAEAVAGDARAARHHLRRRG